MASTGNATYLTPSDHPKGSPNGSVKPTLLAFHGSGSNATIHTVQLARLTRVIKQHFEVESLEAPFPSPAGPGILPFFDGCGPFKRWLPSSTKVSIEDMRLGNSTSILSREVEDLVKTTVLRLQAQGSKVVGLIGFSQGTRVVAGLLRASELRREFGLKGEDVDWCDFELGLSVCGSYPPFLFPASVASRLPEGTDYSGGKVKTPAFHVLGKQDEWVWAGQGLIDMHYEVGEGRSEVVEWDMGHHYPVQPEQSETIAGWMIGVLKKIEKEEQVR